MNINFTLIAQAIAFAVLIWFTVKFVWPPLLKAIETNFTVNQINTENAKACAISVKLMFIFNPIKLNQYVKV